MRIADHLSLQELRERVKKEKDPVARLRFLAVYQAKRGLGARTIAEHTGYTTRWVHATLKRYNEGGPEALADFRHRNPGAKPKLTPEESAQVAKALEGPPPDGGLWTGLKLRRWVAENLGKRLSLNPIYRLLHEMGFSLKVPRPLHRKADKAGQEDFKKSSFSGSGRRGRRGGGSGSSPTTSTDWD